MIRITEAVPAGLTVLLRAFFGACRLQFSGGGSWKSLRANSFAEGFMHNTGRLKAKLTGELVSDFNFTDEEKTMRALAWNLIRPPHAEDWISSDLLEIPFFNPECRPAFAHRNADRPTDAAD